MTVPNVMPVHDFTSEKSHHSERQLPSFEDAAVRSPSWFECFRDNWSRCKGAFLGSAERRGIQRYQPEERQARPRLAVLAVAKFWFSLNLSTLNISVGMTGPRYFVLSLKDASLIAVVAITLASIPVGLVASMGPKSGLRTTTINRFIVGWYPAKMMSIVYAMMIMGYNTLDIIAAGNLLSALSPNISAAPTLATTFLGAFAVIIAACGGKILHLFERWVWWPQLIVVAMLVGAMIPRLKAANFDPDTATSSISIGAGIGFFSIVFASVVTYSSIAADFFADWPEDTHWWVTSIGTVGGLWFSYMIAIGLGIAMGSGADCIPSWATAYKLSPAALVVAVTALMGNVGKLCSVVLTVGNLAAAVAGIYSQSLALQNIDSLLARVPRVTWTMLSGSLVILCAVSGQKAFATCLQSFVTVVGCLTTVWLTVLGVELILHGGCRYSWSRWDDKVAMPPGLAALLAHCLGFSVAVLSMAQPWYVGPIAALAGNKPVDVCPSYCDDCSAH